MSTFSSAFTYNRLPQHQVTIYRDEDRLSDGSRPSECSILGSLISWLCYIILVLTFPISVLFSVKVIRDYERVVTFRLGRLLPQKGPGVIFVIPCLDHWTRVDMRAKAFSVPPQEVHCTDGGGLSVGANVQFKLQDAILSQTVVHDLNHSLRMLAQVTLSRALEGKTAIIIQMDRKIINMHLQDTINLTAHLWGVQVERVELSDIRVLKGPSEATETASNTLSMLFSGGSVNKAMSSGSGKVSGAVSSLPNTTEHAQPDSSLLTPSELFKMISGVLSEGLVQSIQGTFQFNILGENGGTWYVDLKNGTGRITTSGHPIANPDTVLTISISDMQQIFYGQVTAFNAYIQGALKVEGDLKMAMNLEALVNMLKEKAASTKAATKDTQPGVYIV